MSNKVIIACTVTVPGDYAGNDSPQLIADSVYVAWKAGASICRLCMIDGRGNILLSKEQLEETIRLIRAYKECDVIIACDFFGEVSAADNAGSIIFNTVVGIEIGTCTIGTVNYEGESAIYNTPVNLKELMTIFNNKKIKPECRVLDMGMLGNTKWLLKSDYLSLPPFIKIEMGIVGGGDASIENLLFIVRNLPAGTVWSASVGKDAQMAVIYSSIVLGGNISIDLVADGECANVSMIERTVAAIKEFGKDIATVIEAREILQSTAK